MNDTKTVQDSSIKVDGHYSDGIVIHHFTGILLVSRFEANHLRALLGQELQDMPEMSATEATEIIAEREALVSAALRPGPIFPILNGMYNPTPEGEGKGKA